MLSYLVVVCFSVVFFSVVLLLDNGNGKIQTPYKIQQQNKSNRKTTDKLFNIQ